MIKIEHAVFALPFAFLAYEHSLVKPSDLRKVNTAFFAVNGWISILLLVTTSLDLFWKKTA